VVYADDIILVTFSVSVLQNALKICQRELEYLDMAVNTKKTCCLRIGPRANISCTPIQTLSGISLQWFTKFAISASILYIQSSRFKISLDRPKRSFYRVANSIFGRVGRVASKEVTIQLFSSKCVPILLYGLEACVLNKHQIASLDFVINRFFMKLFRTNNIDIVKACQEFFGFQLPSVQIAKRTTVQLNSKFNFKRGRVC